MGGSQNTEVQTKIKNAINTEIENYTQIITNVSNSSTTEAINSLITNNKTELGAVCSGGSSFSMTNCSIINGNILINQNLNLACVTDVMAKIEHDTSWQAKFQEQLNSSFADAVQNNNSLLQAMDAKNELMKSASYSDLGGVIASIMQSLGKAVNSVTGTNTDDKTITEITNEFKTKFSNKTYNESDTRNIINNIINNSVTLNTISSCNIKSTGFNDVTFDNCNLLNTILSLNQNTGIQSLQKCSQGVVEKMLTENANIIEALQTASKNSTNTNSANTTGKAESTVSLINSFTGSLLGMLGLGDFGPIINIMIIYI